MTRLRIVAGVIAIGLLALGGPLPQWIAPAGAQSPASPECEAALTDIAAPHDATLASPRERLFMRDAYTATALTRRDVAVRVRQACGADPRTARYTHEALRAELSKVVQSIADVHAGRDSGRRSDAGSRR